MSAFIYNPKRDVSQAAFVMQVSSNIEKAEALLRSIPGGAEKALDKAILSARREHAKLAETAIRKNYNITAEALHKKDGARARIRPIYRKRTSAVGRGVVHEILYSGHNIPLAEFHRNPQDIREGKKRFIFKKNWRGNPPDVYLFQASRSPQIHVKKDGKAATITRAFVAKVQAGKGSTFHVGIFERKEEHASMMEVMSGDGLMNVINGDSAIEQKYGPSVEHMLSNEDVREEVDGNMSDAIYRALDEKIMQILDGRLSV